MAETDASLKFDEPLEGPATAPLSEEALSRSTVNSPATAVTNYMEETAEEGGGFQPGMQLGPYKLESKLGEGGMGIVFKAVHTKLDKLVAIKILPSAYLNQKSALARFEREMKAVGRLQHANVVQAFDAGEEQGTHFLVMEYVEGTDLQRLVMTRGVFTIENACKAVYQSALGLEAAHEMGLVHRDIKPSNLFVTKSGQIKILDLGLARLQDDGEGGALTYSGQCFGTPEYMAPEQWEDVHACDGRTDLYALGCTLFFLLVGRPPYGGDDYKTAPRKMLGHINDAVPDLIALRSDVPAELDQVYHRLMAKKAGDRYATAAELAQALVPWIDGSSAITAVMGTKLDGSSHSSGSTIAERTLAEGSAKSRGADATEALLSGGKGSPTLVQASVDDSRTTMIPPSAAPSRRWLGPAIGGGVALAALATVGIWAMQSKTPSVTPAPIAGDPPKQTDPVPVASKNTPVEGAPLESTPMPQSVVDRWVSLPNLGFQRGPAWSHDGVLLSNEPISLTTNVETGDAISLELSSLDESSLDAVAALDGELLSLSRTPAALDQQFTEVELIPVGPTLLKFPADVADVKAAQKLWAEQLKLDPVVKNSVEMELVLLPPGEFSMGSDAKQHTVKITRAFYVGKYEVLQGEYLTVMGVNPARFSPTGFFKDKVKGLSATRLPVDSVTWDDAIQFCNKLSAKEQLEPYYTPGGNIAGGNGYRLLTEAEWEYACRAGTDTNFAFGQKLGADAANIRSSNLKRTEEAGKFAANPFGLCDFHGNLAEWCFDFFDDDFVKRNATDPSGPKTGTTRIRRGGSWTTDANLSSSYFRAYLKPGEKPNDSGFRVCRTVVVPASASDEKADSEKTDTEQP